jgi:tape measure domain-containing protein
MAIARTLTTLINFKYDPTALKQFEVGLSRVKDIAKTVLTSMGVLGAMDFGFGMIKDLISAAKEMNRLTLQIQQLSRAGDDLAGIQSTLVASAGKLGVSYTAIGDLFKEFLNNSQSASISQESLLSATENVFKAMRVNRLKPEEMQGVTNVLNMAFRRGQLSIRALNTIADESPRLMKLLQSATGKTEEELLQLAKDHKLTADFIIENLSRVNTALEKDFAETPFKMAEAWNYLYLNLVEATSAVWKVIDAGSFLAKYMVLAVHKVRMAVIDLVQYLGGLKNTLQLIGIAMAVAFGPLVLRYIFQLIAATGGLIARNWVLMLQYGSLALLIAGIAVAIQDLAFWFAGKKSFIGSWVGPFEQLAENFKKLDIFSGFRLFGDLFAGDWKGAWEELKTLLGSTEAQVLLVATAATTVATLFTAWKLMKFTGLIAGINAITQAVVASTVEINAANAATTAWGNSAGWVTILGKLGPIGKVLALTIQMYNLVSEAIAAPRVEKTEEQKSWWDRKLSWTGFGERWMKNIFGGDDKPKEPTPADKLGFTPLVLPDSLTNDIKAFLDYTKTMPGVTPGAVTPGTSVVNGPQTIAPVVNQTNNINVKTDSEQEISTSIAAELERITNQANAELARSIATSAPRVEGATQ